VTNAKVNLSKIESKVQIKEDASVSLDGRALNKNLKITADEKNARKQNNVKWQECKICGKKAKCFSFYGVTSCDACRSFFKRAILSLEEVACEGKGSCQPDCRKCRLDRCLQAGMQPWLITNRRERVKRGVAPQFTLEDEIYISGLWSGMIAESSQLITDYIQANTLVREGLDASYQTLYGNEDFKVLATKCMSEFFMKLSEFSSKPGKQSFQQINKYVPLFMQLSWAQAVYKPSLRFFAYEDFASCVGGKAEKLLRFGEFNNCSSTFAEPRALLYDNAFPKVPQDMKRKHKALAYRLGKCYLLDKVSSMLSYLVIVLEEDMASRARYLRLLHLYTTTKRTTNEANLFAKNIAELSHLLSEMKDMSKW